MGIAGGSTGRRNQQRLRLAGCMGLVAALGAACGDATSGGRSPNGGTPDSDGGADAAFDVAEDAARDDAGTDARDDADGVVDTDTGSPGDTSGVDPIDDPHDDAADTTDVADGVDLDIAPDADAGPDDVPLEAGDDADDAEADAADVEEDTYDDELDPECRFGSFCGRPPTCCPGGSVCIAEECLPVCPSGVRCGPDRDVCCDEGDVCLEGACTAPRGACEDSLDCEPGEFCELTLNRCLPQAEEVSCEVFPDFEDIRMDVEWSWTDGEVISIPVIADVRGNGWPDVIVNQARIGNSDWVNGELVALDGRDGSLLWRVPHAPDDNRWGTQGRSTIALGDVDGDGLPDVIYAARTESGSSRIVAVNGEGETIWTSRNPDGSIARFNVVNGAITVANLDDDPEAEIIVGASILDHDGTVLWNQSNDGPNFGSNDGYRGGIAVVADLDGDGAPEIITGRHAWKVELSSTLPRTATVTPFWDAQVADGYPAVADMNGDGQPEVVLVGARNVRVLDGRTGEPFCALASCAPSERVAAALLPGGSTNNRGGPPTIADFDGDGRPEIGVAGGFSYLVYDLARPGESDVVAGTAPGQLFVRWERATRDRSSNATGSSVFDFNGDGAAEVVYADECHLRVYEGATGRVLIEIPNSNGTIHEYPLVVDIDGDGRSEIVVTANVTGAGGNCPFAGYVPRRGVYVYGDPDNAWLRTRRVWTQHAYHVTNATSAGNPPFREEPNWLNPSLNNYRQNVQGEGVYNAPDLRLESFGFDTSDCFSARLGLVARISNVGSLGVPAGVPVAFHQGVDADAPLLGVEFTSTALLPGEETRVTLWIDLPPRGQRQFHVVIDGGVSGVLPVVECDETNNAGSTSMDDCLGY